MSLLDSIKSKRKVLKNTETIVTRVDGRKIKETKDRIEIVGMSCGYVVDTKPDRIPAKVIDNLYLGAQDCCERDVLDEYDLKVVLSVGIEPPAKYQNITYKHIECLDLPETDIKNILDVAVPFIDQHIGNSNILVHCNAGISRSASVVIGYLILRKDIDYKKALQICRNARACVKPNAGFERRLRSLSDSIGNVNFFYIKK